MQKALDYNHPCVSNSGSPLTLIMCKAHFHMKIRLHSKCGGAWGHGPVAESALQKNKGQLRQFDWRAVEKGEGFSTEAVGWVCRISTFCIAYPAMFLELIICPPKKCQKDEPRHSQARPCLQSHSDLISLRLLKDRRVSRHELWISFISPQLWIEQGLLLVQPIHQCLLASVATPYPFPPHGPPPPVYWVSLLYLLPCLLTIILTSTGRHTPHSHCSGMLVCDILNPQ